MMSRIIKYLIYSTVLIILFTSCTNVHDPADGNQDTSIHLFLDSVASYGTEIIAHYTNDTLFCCSVLAKDDTKKTLIRYYLDGDSVEVNQIDFFYKYALSTKPKLNIDSLWDEMIDSVSVVNYILNYNGDIIWKDDSTIKIIDFYPIVISLRH